jgi:hypothetical protein
VQGISKLLVFYNEEEIDRHDKVYVMNLWHIDIMHYAKNLFRKPKELVNSTAFKQMDSVLKQIYSKYFSSNERDFIKLIELVGTYGLTVINNSIKNLNEACPAQLILVLIKLNLSVLEKIILKSYIFRIILMKLCTIVLICLMNLRCYQNKLSKYDLVILN